MELLNVWKSLGDRWNGTAKRIYEAVEWCISHRSMKGIEKMDFAFDPTGIEPQFGGGGNTLPVGKHPVTITKSEGKPTKDNTGGYLELTCVAFDGPAKGGSIAIRLNVHNTNELAVKIAKQQLAAIMAVAGVGPFQNTQALHEKPFVIEVGPQKGDTKYTEVIGVFDMNGNEPGQSGGGASGTGTIPPQQQGGGNGGFGAGAGNGAGTGAQGGGNGGFGAGAGNGGGNGGGGFGGGAGNGSGGGGGNGWQQGGGGGGGSDKPGWGQR